MNYEFINNNKRLESFFHKHESAHWLAFDCEFDKKSEYNKTLSLITVKSKFGLYAIDCLSTDYLNGFISILIDMKVQKITHSGKNDYEIFYQKTKQLPQNVVDTQILSPFIEYIFPSSLEGLLAKYLDIAIKKDQSVSDWLKRPLLKEQIEYAILDVKYLDVLCKSILSILKSKNRKEWALEKCKDLSNKDSYTENDLEQLLSIREITKMTIKEFTFFIRLMKWQKSTEYISKSELFKNRYMTDLLRTVKHGKECMLNDTRVVKTNITKHLDDVINFYESPVTKVEEQNYNTIFKDSIEKRKRSNSLEIIYLLINQKCIDQNIHTSTIITKKDLKKMKNIRDYVNIHFKEYWKIEILGEGLIDLIRRVDHFEYEIKDDKFIVYFKKK